MDWLLYMVLGAIVAGAGFGALGLYLLAWRDR